MTQRIELLVKLNLSYMTQRIELSRIWLKELNPFDLTRTIESFFLKVTHRIELFFFFLNVTHRIDFFLWKWLKELNPFPLCLKELNLFWKMTPRIDFLKNINIKKLFLGGTQRIDFFLIIHRTETFFHVTHRNWTLLSNMTHRNWTRLSNMTHRNWTFLFNMTLTYIWLKELNLFLSMSQRIELFSWLKELNFFQNDSKILLKTTQRIKPFFEDDPKNRTSFYWKYVLRIVFQYDSQNWTFFSIT